MADIASLGIEISAKDIKKAVAELDRLENQSGKTEKATDKLSKSYGGLKSALAAVGAVALTKQLIDQINTYQGLTNQLKLVTKDSQELATVQLKLFDIAQDTRGSLEATTDLYSRLARSTKSLGISQEDLLKVTNTVNQAVAISGTNAQAASAALFQLGQGLGANALRGQELNSVMEQTQGLAEALAEGLGVEIGQLKQLGEEGAITGKAFIDAMLKVESSVASKFSQTAKTVSQAMQQIQNVALQTFGTIDSDELIGALDEFKATISDPAVIGGLQSIGVALVKITELSVKAASGWGMIFKAISDFTSEDSEATKLWSLIESTQNQLLKTDDATYKAALGRLLEQYKAQLNAINEADKATKAAAGGGAVAGGDTAPELTDAQLTEIDQRNLATSLALLDKQTEADALLELQQIADEQLILQNQYRLNTLQEQEEASAKARKDIMTSLFGNLTSLMDSSSKTMFKIGKTAALAQAAIDLPAAVTGAYKVGAGIGGPWLGAAYAATAGLAQLNNIQKIKSASFGGGGGAATVSSTTGGAPVTGQIPSLAATPEAAPLPSVQELRVVVEGDGPHSQGMRKFAENLAETIKDMGGVGNLVIS